MAVSKDIEKGTWTSQVWVEDWQGKKKHKKKRGFATKKEALEWEHSILLAAKADMNMKLADFVDLYFRDKETELKARTVRNKRYMIEQHVVPMLGDKPMDGITPADIIQWQNYIRSKGFKETYQRMLQNQLTALFTHATKIYNLKDNPCAKVKRMLIKSSYSSAYWMNLTNSLLPLRKGAGIMCCLTYCFTVGAESVKHLLLHRRILILQIEKFLLQKLIFGTKVLMRLQNLRQRSQYAQ